MKRLLLGLLLTLTVGCSTALAQVYPAHPWVSPQYLAAPGYVAPVTPPPVLLQPAPIYVPSLQPAPGLIVPTYPAAPPVFIGPGYAPILNPGFVSPYPVYGPGLAPPLTGWGF